MKKALYLIVTLFLSTVSIHAKAQAKITAAEASKHVGDSVIVCDKAYGGIYLDKSKDGFTFINIGAKYPDQKLTLVIKGDVRKTFSFVPEKVLSDKNICVKGKITEYKGKPQIMIDNEDQIEIR